MTDAPVVLRLAAAAAAAAAAERENGHLAPSLELGCRS